MKLTVACGVCVGCIVMMTAGLVTIALHCCHRQCVVLALTDLRIQRLLAILATDLLVSERVNDLPVGVMFVTRCQRNSIWSHHRDAVTLCVYACADSEYHQYKSDYDYYGSYNQLDDYAPYGPSYTAMSRGRGGRGSASTFMSRGIVSMCGCVCDHQSFK